MVTAVFPSVPPLLGDLEGSTELPKKGGDNIGPLESFHSVVDTFV